MSEQRKARLCVPVCVSRAGALPEAIERAAALADFVELRLDYLSAAQLDAALALLPEQLARHEKAFILTFRPQEQGGARPLSFDERISFWRKLELPAEDPRAEIFADIELDLLPTLREQAATKGLHALAPRRVICSFHDFAGVPSQLESIYEEMLQTEARVLKIAVSARSITDCLVLFRLLERARRDGREMIAVAMGEAGLLTRVLAPSRGAFLTFAALDAEHATAPGQLEAGKLRRLYRFASINEETQICALIGSPVAHSLSPHIQNAAFAATAIDAVYLPLEVADADAFMRRMAHPRTRELNWPLRGLSVTAPHKTAVIPHLDWLNEAASEIGAVNTIVCTEDRLLGYNTDAAAFVTPLETSIALEGARVAVIGAGGAARAALWSLRARGAQLTVFARDPVRARPIADEFGAQVSSIAEAQLGDFHVVVNATPLGTRGAHEHKTPARARQMRGAHICYDLVYNPSETLFLREARKAGCQTIGGLSMLVAQAAAQLKLWTGREAPLGVMRGVAEAEVGSRSRRGRKRSEAV